MKKKAKKDGPQFDCVLVEAPKKLPDNTEDMSITDSNNFTHGRSEGDAIIEANKDRKLGPEDGLEFGHPSRKRSQSLTEELGLCKSTSKQSEGFQSAKNVVDKNVEECTTEHLRTKEEAMDESLRSSIISGPSESNEGSQGHMSPPPPPDIDELKFLCNIPDPVMKKSASPQLAPSLQAKGQRNGRDHGKSIGIQASQAIPMPPPLPKQRSPILEERIRSIVDADEGEMIQSYFKDGPLVYRLVGVLIHRGGAYGGHYYAYIRSFEDNKWHMFDDAIIKAVDKRQVAEEGFGGKTMTASGYMLFYQIVEDSGTPADWLDIPKDLRDICSAELAREREQGRMV
jgi:hypothetical protein